MHDGAQVQFFRGDEGKAVGQRIADLQAEIAACAGAGAVGGVLTVVQHGAERV